MYGPALVFRIHLLTSGYRSRRYYDPEMAGYGALRVVNEDRVAPARGFGTHRHSEMEIFSYIVSGELEQYVWLTLA